MSTTPPLGTNRYFRWLQITWLSLCLTLKSLMISSQRSRWIFALGLLIARKCKILERRQWNNWIPWMGWLGTSSWSALSEWQKRNMWSQTAAKRSQRDWFILWRSLWFQICGISSKSTEEKFITTLNKLTFFTKSSSRCWITCTWNFRVKNAYRVNRISWAGMNSKG